VFILVRNLQKIWNDKQVTVLLAGELQAEGLNRNCIVQEVTMIRALKITGWNQAPKPGATKTSYSYSEFPYSKQASKHPHSSLYNCSLLVVSVTVLAHLEYHLQWSSLSVSKTITLLSLGSSHLQGRFAADFQEGGWAWAPDHMSSANWRHL
jgi:hypothetical protein